MITLTEGAAAKVRELLQREGRPSGALRLRVTAGGCSDAHGASPSAARSGCPSAARNMTLFPAV